MNSIQEALRGELRDAKREGLIRSFRLRPNGRATIYLDGERKRYTTSTLDTLACLSELRRKEED